MIQKATKYIIFVIFALAFGLTMLGLYWMYWPYEAPVKIHSVELVTPVVIAGEDAVIYLKTEKTVALPCIVIRELINDYTRQMKPFESNIPMGMFDSRIRVRIPESTTEGDDYKIHTTYVYQINPLRKMYIEWTTSLFTVIKRNAEVKRYQLERYQFEKDRAEFEKEKKQFYERKK